MNRTRIRILAVAAWTCLATAPSLAFAQATEPRIEHLDLWVRLDPPGGFRARARLELAGLEDQGMALMLNDSLRVSAATCATSPGRADKGDGERAEVSFQHGWGNPFDRFHSEGRFVLFDGLHVDAKGRAELTIEYGGEGEFGDEGSDWRGILFVDRDQVRMSEQTIFYPQLSLPGSGPGIQRSSTRVEVDAPEAFEVFVPGRAFEPQAGDEPGRRVWCFESTRPTSLSLLAGMYERVELARGGAELTLLLRAEHASLAGALAEEAQSALAFYQRTFGTATREPDEEGPVRLGIVEIACRRGTSINWASEGVAAFDRGAFGNGVPVGSLAHEVAHLWWGLGVRPAGRGERFLTESLAEYAAWRYLAERDRSGAEQGEVALEERAVRRAHGRYRSAIEAGQDRNLGDLTFRTPGYSALAYAKGPLVLRAIEDGLGREAMDRALADYAGGEGRPATPDGGSLERFLGALAREGSPAAFEPWFRTDGHRELAVEGVAATEDGRVRGVLVLDDPRRNPDGAGEAGSVSEAPLGTVVVEVALPDGKFLRQRVPLTGARTAFDLPCTDAPLRLQVDPDHAWPGVWIDAIHLDGPRLVESDPAQGARAVPYGLRELRLRFDRPMAGVDFKGLSAAQWRDGRWGPVVHGFTLDGETITLAVSPLRPGKDYSFLLGEWFADRRGGISMTETLDFRTAESEDRTPPRVVFTSPARGTADVEPGALEVEIVFDEPMAPGRGFKTTLLREFAAGGVLFPDITGSRWEPDYRTLRYTLEDLQPGTRYVLPLRGTLFRDLSGNPLEDHDLTFRVRGEAQGEARAER